MQLNLYSEDIMEYLRADDIIDFYNPDIVVLAERLSAIAVDELDYTRLAYEYVRDKIFHSADINNDLITCTASEVLDAGHGICFAKSHLLAALLRCKAIPCGFCYQKIILDDNDAPFLIYHGLNGVYLQKCAKWIRLDARGNKASVNAMFSTEEEHLAFPVRPELGECDILTIYPKPDINIIEALRTKKTRRALWEDLPKALAYRNEVK